MEYQTWTGTFGNENRLLLDIYEIMEKYCFEIEMYAGTFLKKANKMVVGYDDGVPQGFIAAIQKDENVYIGAICSKPGTGYKILNEFLKAADKHHKIVSLEAIDSTLGYYGLFGFEFRKSCGPTKVFSAVPFIGKKRNVHYKLFEDLTSDLMTHGLYIRDFGYPMMRCKPFAIFNIPQKVYDKWTEWITTHTYPFDTNGDIADIRADTEEAWLEWVKIPIKTLQEEYEKISSDSKWLEFYDELIKSKLELI